MISGLDLAVQEMKLAEEALITLQPQYAYGGTGHKGPLADVPPDTPVTFRVHLVSFEKVGPPQRQTWPAAGAQREAAPAFRRTPWHAPARGFRALLGTCCGPPGLPCTPGTLPSRCTGGAGSHAGR